VVVEALGGIEPARTAIAVALRAGAHVVTANKAALAAHGAELEALAAASGRALLASAAAGGSVPLLPALRRLARGADCVRLDAVLNGTTTFVFEALARGSSLDEALTLARRRGLCERDVQRDLSGRDAADKLVLAAHAATGCWLDARAIRCTPIGPADLARAQCGAVMRQVATLRRQGGALVGRVRPMALAPGHPLARARGAGNSAVLFTAGGRTRLHGTGAGRWPTAEAVIGDLFELLRERERMALADVA
jgi:homoserine dehydrogenase